VSKLLPDVSKESTRFLGALNRYQIDRPPRLPATRAGSPASFVALAVEPVSVPPSPVSTVAADQASLGGAGAGVAVIRAPLASGDATVIDQPSGVTHVLSKGRAASSENQAGEIRWSMSWTSERYEPPVACTRTPSSPPTGRPASNPTAWRYSNQ
jgi:hypothetical protein